MVKGLEHIGIAVKDLAVAVPLYEKLLGVAPYKTEDVVSEQVRTVFFQTGASKIELLGSLDPAGVISRFVEKNGEGIHHLAFEVEDIYAEMQRLQNEGFTLVNGAPKQGADNKLICFLHPRSTGGVLVELCQEIK